MHSTSFILVLMFVFMTESFGFNCNLIYKDYNNKHNSLLITETIISQSCLVHFENA